MNRKSLIKCFSALLLVLSLFGCVQSKDMIWSFKHKGEVVAQFLLENEKILLYTPWGVHCYNLLTGHAEWNREDVYFVFSQAFADNVLYLSSKSTNDLFFINVDTGEYMKLLDVDGGITSTVVQGDLLYYISSKSFLNSQRVLKTAYTLRSMNLLSNNDERIIYQFTGKLHNSLIIHEDSILLLVKENSVNKIVCLNRKSGSLNWEREIYFRGLLTDNYLAPINNSLFFIDMQKDVKNCLVEVDIRTGEEIKRIKPKGSEWFSYSDYVTSSHIGFDGNNILVHGDKDFVYNIETDEIKKLSINGYGSIINDGNIIYHDNNSVFIFNLEEETGREIFQLRGKEVFQIFAEKEYVLLVLAKNIRKDIVSGNDLTYVMLKVELDWLKKKSESEY